jgi:hypothetical protein
MSSEKTCPSCGKPSPAAERPHHIPGTPYRREAIPTVLADDKTEKCLGIHPLMYIWLAGRGDPGIVLYEQAPGEVPAKTCQVCGKPATWTLNASVTDNSYAPVGGCAEHDKDQVAIHLIVRSAPTATPAPGGTLAP